MANSLNKVKTSGVEDDAVTADKLANAINTDIAAKAVLTGSTNNTITTVTGANAIQGESGLTYDGSDLNISNDIPQLLLTDTNSNNSYGRVRGNGGNLILSADVNNATGSSIINFEIDGSEKARIDSGGRLGLGVTPKSWHSNNKGVIQGDSGYSILGRSDNWAAFAQNFYYDSSDAGKYIETGEASIYIQQDGDHKFFSAANGSADAAAALGEKVRIRSGGGLTFNGDTSASNALDDYEEGTWTPTMSSASSATMTVQKGRYTKVGNKVNIWFDMTWSAASSLTAGRIGGLPYTGITTQQQGGYGAPQFRDATGISSNFRVYGTSSYFNSAEISLKQYNSSGVEESASYLSSGRITGQGFYFVNNAY